MKKLLEQLQSALCHVEDVRAFHAIDEEASDRLECAALDIQDSMNMLVMSVLTN